MIVCCVFTFHDTESLRTLTRWCMVLPFLLQHVLLLRRRSYFKSNTALFISSILVIQSIILYQEPKENSSRTCTVYESLRFLTTALAKNNRQIIVIKQPRLYEFRPKAKQIAIEM